VNCATVGSVPKTCQGNEPGTLEEIVSLNASGPATAWNRHRFDGRLACRRGSRPPRAKVDEHRERARPRRDARSQRKEGACCVRMIRILLEVEAHRAGRGRADGRVDREDRYARGGRVSRARIGLAGARVFLGIGEQRQSGGRPGGGASVVVVRQPAESVGLRDLAGDNLNGQREYRLGAGFYIAGGMRSPSRAMIGSLRPRSRLSDGVDHSASGP
jgi:hypothetical protein